MDLRRRIFVDRLAPYWDGERHPRVYMFMLGGRIEVGLGLCWTFWHRKLAGGALVCLGPLSVAWTHLGRRSWHLRIILPAKKVAGHA